MSVTITPHARTQVREILDKSYQRAWACLQTHRSDLDLLANALIKHETLTGAEIKDLLMGKPIKVAPVDVKTRSPKTTSTSSSSSTWPAVTVPSGGARAGGPTVGGTNAKANN